MMFWYVTDATVVAVQLLVALDDERDLRQLPVQLHFLDPAHPDPGHPHVVAVAQPVYVGEHGRIRCRGTGHVAAQRGIDQPGQHHRDDHEERQPDQGSAESHCVTSRAAVSGDEGHRGPPSDRAEQQLGGHRGRLLSGDQAQLVAFALAADRSDIAAEGGGPGLAAGRTPAPPAPPAATPVPGVAPAIGGLGGGGWTRAGFPGAGHSRDGPDPPRQRRVGVLQTAIRVDQRRPDGTQVSVRADHGARRRCQAWAAGSSAAAALRQFGTHRDQRRGLAARSLQLAVLRAVGPGVGVHRGERQVGPHVLGDRFGI